MKNQVNLNEMEAAQLLVFIKERDPDTNDGLLNIVQETCGIGTKTTVSWRNYKDTTIKSEQDITDYGSW